MRRISGTHILSSYSPSRTFGGRGEPIWRMLSGQQRENEGSFHEQSQGAMSSVRIVHLE